MATAIIPFLRAFISDPQRTAAIAPSSQALAEAITAEISRDTGPVIELGPGTGVFTQQLLKRGIPPYRLALVEYGSDFVRFLQWRFPHSRVLWMDAARLKDVELFDHEKAGAVISGLPLLSMPARKIIAILDGAMYHVRSGGAFYQFTYGPRCPVPRVILDRLGLKAVRMSRVIANLPPAAVYRISRRPPRRLAFDRRGEDAAEAM